MVVSYHAEAQCYRADISRPPAPAIRQRTNLVVRQLLVPTSLPPWLAPPGSHRHGVPVQEAILYAPTCALHPTDRLTGQRTPPLAIDFATSRRPRRYAILSLMTSYTCRRYEIPLASMHTADR